MLSKHDGEHDHQVLSMSATVMLSLMLKGTKKISPKTDHIFKIYEKIYIINSTHQYNINQLMTFLSWSVKHSSRARYVIYNSYPTVSVDFSLLFSPSVCQAFVFDHAVPFRLHTFWKRSDWTCVCFLDPWLWNVLWMNSSHRVSQTPVRKRMLILPARNKGWGIVFFVGQATGYI